MLDRPVSGPFLVGEQKPCVPWIVLQKEGYRHEDIFKHYRIVEAVSRYYVVQRADIEHRLQKQAPR